MLRGNDGQPCRQEEAWDGLAERLAAGLGVPVALAWRHPLLGEGRAASPGAQELEVHGDGPLRRCWQLEGGGEIAIALAGEPQAPQDWSAWTGCVLPARLELAAALRRNDQLRKSERLQQALYAIADLSGSMLELQDMLREIHRIVGELMYAENFYIVLYDADAQTMRFLYFVDQHDPWVNDPEADLPVEEANSSLTLTLMRTGNALRGPSRMLHDRFGIAYTRFSGPHSADWLGVPMLRDGRVVGAIVVQSYVEPDCYDDEDRVLLAFVAQHILTALDRRQAREQLELNVQARTRELSQANLELQTEIHERQRAQQLQRALFRIAQQSIGSQSLQEFYGELHSIVGDLLPAHNFYIALLSDDGQRLEFPYSVDEHQSIPASRPLGKGMTEYVLSGAKPILADRQTIGRLEASGKVRSVGPHAYHWLGVPLMEGERPVGVMAVQSYSPEVRFTRADQELLTFVAHHIGIGLARKRAQDRLLLAHSELERRVEERTRELAEANAELVAQIAERMRTQRKLAHQAQHDILTGLPNRAQLLNRLRQAIARARGSQEARFAVLFLDLDRFKLVNDSVGHAVGDELLVEVARRLVGAVRNGDTVCRLGGDEFAILAEGLEDGTRAEDIARRVLQALGSPVWIGGRELYPSASIGIALWHPRYDNGEDMLRDADAAMYRAKAEGRDRSAMFDEAMREQATRTLDLEAELRRALHNESFEPHYQPIARLSDGGLAGHEALLRWHHDHRGLLAPAEFIDVGEETGLIEQVDWLLYAHVIAHMAGPLKRGYVAINVSPRHFRSSNFAQRLIGLLQTAGVEPARLRIEITEVALLEDSPRALQTLRTLREHGVLAQLDDFGTGYSALSYLHRFPIASLKIDRSFVAGLDAPNGTESLAVVRAIIVLARSLGIESIAEGIETEAQCRALMELGCDYGQGWLLGRPMSMELAALAV